MVSNQQPVFFDGKYLIEENGTIHSLRTGKALKPRWNGSHWQVMLYVNGQRKNHYVHHLVLECFVGPRPSGLKGLHKDDDPNNNHLNNLYWGTSSQNTQDAVRNGRHHHAKKIQCRRGHVLQAPNLGKSAGRACLACNRANTLANYHGIDDEEYRQKLADQKFAEIMKAAG